jgi:hypothetical protein
MTNTNFDYDEALFIFILIREAFDGYRANVGCAHNPAAMVELLRSPWLVSSD